MTVDVGPGTNADGAGTNASAQAEAQARRWPADWFSRYDRPVAHIIPRSNAAPAPWTTAPRAERAIVAAGTDAEVYPVRWPQLVGQPLPPITSATSVMGAAGSPPARP
ncbi:MAG: hypothetical protein Q8R01_04975 [Ramlibacter sp.]|nr:hypothetical protein [Ramlibacter sp.]